MKILLPLILFVATSSIFAADPFHGTWQQNDDLKSGPDVKKWDPPWRMKVEVKENKAIFYFFRGSRETTYLLDGTPTLNANPQYGDESVSFKRIDTHTWEYHRSSQGKIGKDNPTPFNQDGYYTISSNGNFLYIAMSRTFADGRSYYGIRVLEKQ